MIAANFIHARAIKTERRRMVVVSYHRLASLSFQTQAPDNRPVHALSTVNNRNYTTTAISALYELTALVLYTLTSIIMTAMNPATYEA